MKVTNHTGPLGRRYFLRIGALGALGVSLDGVHQTKVLDTGGPIPGLLV